jgi:hypothetical protein
VTPNSLSASTAALTIAGVEPSVPASPTPFAPSGLTGVGVTVLSSSNQGKSVARGMRVVHERPGQELTVLVVDNLLDHRLADSLGEAAVHLPFDDERVDDVPQSSTATILRSFGSPVSRSISSIEMWQPKG